MDWLAFSLSNLQDAFGPSPHDPRHGMTAAGAEDGSGEPPGVADLMMLTAGSGSPKLEDFLGGCLEEPAGRLPSGATDPDSVLKTIAAGFLRDFPADQPEPDVRGNAKVVAAAAAERKKAMNTFGQRTSIYRGVTRHRCSGRYEAHLWDNNCRREGQIRKGRQVYLGGYDKEEKAARAYDLAALKYWGPTTTTTNFPVSNYEKELEEMKNLTRQEFVASLRRKSSGFSRGASIYRGVTRHHQHGRWQARIGRVAGNKDLYLGTFSTQEEAAEAYDIAAIKFRGLNAVTNFDMSRYDVNSIVTSNLPIGGMASPKVASDSPTSPSDARNAYAAKPVDALATDDPGSSTAAPFALAMPVQQHQDYWPLLALPQQQQSQQTSDQSSSQSFTVYPSAANMDFSSATATVVGQGNGSLLLSSGMLQHHQQQQHNNSCSRARSTSVPSLMQLPLLWRGLGHTGGFSHAHLRASCQDKCGVFPDTPFWR